ncbi:hypothetical protein M9H77_04224 [Catharanthus roseus]|uniref:Uncharacterized protein n=1 Tax=Catharanthus roseus TaxID=4058 RepID=A0ACC0CDJ9_CATRO|nr:hypothetical protein M9H77_04224 [Catharanthus roseus]
MAENENDDCIGNFASIEDQEEHLVVGEDIERHEVECKKTAEAAHSRTKEIEAVMHVREVKARAGTYIKFLVKWIGRLDYENSWISEKEVMHIDPNMCQTAKTTTRTKARSYCRDCNAQPVRFRSFGGLGFEESTPPTPLLPPRHKRLAEAVITVQFQV